MSAFVAVGLAAAALLAAIGALVRAARKDGRDVAAYKRQRTADRVLDDTRAWRSAQDLKTCRAIWPDAPLHIPQQRKETGQ